MIHRGHLFNVLGCFLLLMGLSKPVSCQSPLLHNEIGLDLLTVSSEPDILYSLPYRVYPLLGGQYQYHFEKFTLRAGIDYFTVHVNEGAMTDSSHTLHISAGVEKSFFNGRFRLTEGVNIVAQRYTGRYKNNWMSRYSNKKDVGPAITGGFRWQITPHIALAGNMDVEFFFQGEFDGWYIPFNLVRMATLNYSF